MYKRLKFIILFSMSLFISCNKSKKSDVSERLSIKNQEVMIDYSDNGKGDTTLLFVHGWAINKSYWKSQIDYFSKDYRVIAIDLPGFGKSGSNRNNWTVEEYGKDISEVLTQLDLENVILIGHSMSGNIVVETALNNSERIIGVIGIDNLKNLGYERTPENQKEEAEWFAKAKKNFKPFVTDYIYQALLLENTDSLIKKRVVDDMTSPDPKIAIEILELGEKYPIVEKLVALKKPIYLISSDNTPTDTTAFIKNKIDYRLFNIHGTAHYPMIEKPNEFNQILIKVIREVK
jgi:pimeloyl-ACP methyl ester carboxylesterase